MKIAILTFPITLNYGCVLQSFALQTTLEKLGHEVTILDKRDWRASTTRGKSLVALKSLLKYCIGKESFMQTKHKIKQLCRNEKKQGKGISDFVHRHLHLSERIYSFDHKKARFTEFDGYVVGSDQVWRYAYLSRYIQNYYLDFASEESKKISYAASFGIDQTEYPASVICQCKRLAERFDAISVREDSGVAICEKYFNKKAVHVIDPTFLLTPAEYKKQIGFDTTQVKTLQTYILDESEEKRKVIEHIASQHGYDRNDLMPSEHNGLRRFPSVSRWLESLYNARFVITDSFHGTAFAILFNTEFVVMANPERGNARLLSLLKMFNLEKRLISTPREYETAASNRIDWQEVNQKIDSYRDFARSYITESLK